MEIRLKERDMPRGANGDVHFTRLGPHASTVNAETVDNVDATVLDVFTPDEVVELVNRAIYQLEYQRQSHKVRGQRERDKMKLMKAALKQAGVDIKHAQIERELKGEK